MNKTNIMIFHNGISQKETTKMEIKNLRYFLAVAREENMSHAARILHVTQPTLSKVLRSLEDELGKKLFTRHSFSIKLTDEGMLTMIVLYNPRNINILCIQSLYPPYKKSIK